MIDPNGAKDVVDSFMNPGRKPSKAPKKPKKSVKSLDEMMKDKDGVDFGGTKLKRIW